MEMILYKNYKRVIYFFYFFIQLPGSDDPRSWVLVMVRLAISACLVQSFLRRPGRLQASHPIHDRLPVVINPARSKYFMCATGNADIAFRTIIPSGTHSGIHCVVQSTGLSPSDLYIYVV
jgi:hypothetical protein